MESYAAWEGRKGFVNKTLYEPCGFLTDRRLERLECSAASAPFSEVCLEFPFSTAGMRLIPFHIVEHELRMSGKECFYHILILLL